MASSRDYLKRLEALNGGPLRHQGEAQPDVEEIRRRMEQKRAEKQRPPEPEPIHYRRNLPHTAEKTLPASTAGPAVKLEDGAPGKEVIVGACGCAYRIEATLREIEGAENLLSETFQEQFLDQRSHIQRYLTSIGLPAPFQPEDILVFDIETTGLGHSPLFLIGTLSWEDDDLVVRQYFARSYAEEAAVTSLFIEEAREKRLLVSYNGKSFDLPYIRTRAAACRLPFTLAPAHFDLLHTARRICRGKLPNCQLQTLERHICGRTRFGDIPGAEIPDAYHDYVRTGNARRIVQILKHNMLDLVTLAELMTRLPVGR